MVFLERGEDGQNSYASSPLQDAFPAVTLYLLKVKQEFT